MSKAPLKPQDELALAGALLSRASPNLWDNFVKTFEKYAEQDMAACVVADPAGVFQAQGAARKSLDLYALFSTAVERAKQLPQAK